MCVGLESDDHRRGRDPAPDKGAKKRNKKGIHKQKPKTASSNNIQKARQSMPAKFRPANVALAEYADLFKPRSGPINYNSNHDELARLSRFYHPKLAIASVLDNVKKCRHFFNQVRSEGIDSEEIFKEAGLNEGKFFIVEEDLKTAPLMFASLTRGRSLLPHLLRGLKRTGL